MKPQRIQFTREGYQKMENDTQALTEKRKEAVVRLRLAREMGDLSENGAYKAARFELSSIDRELRRLTYLLRVGTISEPTTKDVVDFGSRVTLDDGKNQLMFTLVNKYESNPTQNKLSTESPIGYGVVGKRVGEKVTIKTPSGATTYTVLSVE